MAQNEETSFLATTQEWDVSELYDIDVRSTDFKDFLVRMYQNLNLIASVTNGKDIGCYDINEINNGQQFFPNPLLDSSTETVPTFRSVYRKVINLGPLSNAAGSITPLHNVPITPKVNFTRIYGVANDPVNNDYLPLPYSSANAADVIELSVNLTQVIVTVGKDRSMFTTCYAILEYIKC